MMKSLRNAHIAAPLILLLGVAFALETAAIVGAPATPVSVAGVARRTTRRTAVVASSATAAAATTSAAQASAASAQASAAAASASAAQASAAQASAAAAPAPSGAPAVGTVVAALPAGCTQVQMNGVAYSDCGGVYYRAAFQGENLVYVVQQP